MSKYISIFLLSVVMLLPISLFGQEEEAVVEESDYVRDSLCGFYFEVMDVDITVHADRTYDIVENIDAYFLEPSHGIVREIPTRFWVNRDMSEAQDGTRFELRYNRVDIEDIQVSEEFFESDNQDIKSLRIGSYDRELEGKHHYTISYRLRLPNDRVEYSDQFFHSIVGTSWECSMDTVRFAIHFDKEVPDESLSRLGLYIGLEGNSDNRAHDIIDYADNHTIIGSLYEQPQYWGVTIEIPLPQGYFPTDDLPIWIDLSKIAACVTFLLILIVLFKEVRGDERVTPVITFRPSKDLTSADIGSLIDGEVDDEDLLSLVPWFAAHGHLSIEQNSDGKVLLRKLQDLPSDAPAYQRELFSGFFAKGDVFDVSQTSSYFGAAWERAKDALDRQYKGKLNYFDGTIWMSLLMFAMSLTCCFSLAEPDGWIVGGVVNFFLALLGVGAFYTRTFWKSQIHFSGCAAMLSSCFMLCVYGMFALFGLMLVLSVPMSFDDYYLPTWILGVLMVLTLLVICFVRRLLRMTNYRRERLGEVLGLREFIRTAEEGRLRMLLEKDERYFYNILPFAVAFGLTDKWTEKFKNLSVKELKEFGGVPVAHISHSLNRSRWISHVSNSVVSNRTASSGGSHSRARSSRGGYSGGGSGGGGGHRW